MYPLRRSEAAERLLPLLVRLWDKVDGNLFLQSPQGAKCRGVLFVGQHAWATNGHWCVRMRASGETLLSARDMLSHPGLALWMDGATHDVTTYEIPPGSDPLRECVGPAQIQPLTFNAFLNDWKAATEPIVVRDTLAWLRGQRGRRELGADPAIVTFYRDSGTASLWPRHYRTGRGHHDQMHAVPLWHGALAVDHGWENGVAERSPWERPSTERVMAAGRLFSVDAGYLEGLLELFPEYFVVHACFDPPAPFAQPTPVIFKATAPHRPDIRAALVQAHVF